MKRKEILVDRRSRRDNKGTRRNKEEQGGTTRIIVGLEGVANAMVIYQKAIMDRIPPKDAYKSESWLKVLEPMA